MESHTDLVATLAVAHTLAVKTEADAKKERETIEHAIRLARGTGDVTAEAEAAKTKPTPNKMKSIENQIEQALRSEHAPMSIAALAKMIAAPVGKVAAAMRELKRANRVHNLGTEDHPCWIWIVGDNTPTRELNDHVARLISHQPLTFAQLMAATGARRGRLSGALVEVQKTREDWLNLGDERTYRWFLPPVKAAKSVKSKR